MNLKKSFALLMAAVASLSAWADADYITHRYEAFKACPPREGNVAFIGNSITNMGNWHEHFADNILAQNRGNSGACSYEALANLETVIMDKPAHIFVMIGTNDIGSATGTPATVAANGLALIERVKNESPETKVHIVSTFPSTVGARTVENHTEINNLLKEVCRQTDTDFIDIFDDMMGIINNTISADKLHLTTKGYYIWCNALVPYLDGWTCSLPENTEARNGYVWSNGNGSRVNMLATLPIKPDDILLIGGEMINNGEFHELLSNPHVKNRGATYGYGDYLTNNWKDFVGYMFDLNKATKQTPAKIFVNIGSQDINTNVAMETLQANYRTIVETLIDRAPGAQIYLTALTPHKDVTKNGNTKTFNTFVSTLAAEKGLEYVDLFTPMALEDGTPNPKYITTNLNAPYVSAAGYVHLAHVLAPVIGGCTVEDEDAFEARYELLNARQALGNLVSKTYTTVTGTQTGSVSEETHKLLVDVRDEMYALLNKEGVTVAELNEAYEKYSVIAQQASALNQPAEGRYYHIVTHRNNRMVNMSSPTALVATPMADSDPHSPAYIWQVEKLADGSYNIRNLKHEKYISTSITAVKDSPANGWTFTDHNAVTGSYAITSGNVQFHQLNNGGLTNWGGGNNLTDLGCAFYLNALDDDFQVIDPDNVKYVDEPVGCSEYIDAVFNLKSVRDSKYASEAASGNWILGVDAATDLATWRLYEREDGTYDIKNEQTGHYVDPDNQNASTQNQFMASDNAPAAGWTFTPIEGLEGKYIITSGSNIQFHQAKSPWRIINWGYGSQTAGEFRTTDEGCQYTLEGRILRDDTPQTAVETVSVEAPSAHYDLQGRRALPTARGLHVANGHKILVK